MKIANKIIKFAVILLPAFLIGIVLAFAVSNKSSTGTKEPKTDVANTNTSSAKPTPVPAKSDSTQTEPPANYESFFDLQDLPAGSEIISQTGDVMLFDSNSFRIMYHDSKKAYAIYIYSSPFEKYRSEAENKILEILNIDTVTACSLGIVISTPEFANPVESKNVYLPSYCL